MRVTEAPLAGVMVIEPEYHGDDRGIFMEAWNKRRYGERGITGEFVQDNISVSRRGVLRGLHFQNPHPQGKLVSVQRGEVFDVVVDVRIDSGSFGKWFGVTLSWENKKQVYIPEGFAHGFEVVSEEAWFFYKCTEYFHPEAECTLLWNDPELGIEWPIAHPVVSPKDSKGLPLSKIDRSRFLGLEMAGIPNDRR